MCCFHIISAQYITLDSTVLKYEEILDSSYFEKAWDIDWGFDNKLWINDYRHIKRWDPDAEQLDTVWTFEYGNLLGLSVPEIAMNDTVALYAVLDTHSLYYKAGQWAELHELKFIKSLDKIVESKLVFHYPHNGEHSGGRVEVTSDNKILVTSADFWIDTEDYDRHGKVLRLNPDSSAPDDNCGYFTYSKGHRNPQGLVIVPNGNIFVSEHGQLYGNEEINRIIPCKNYGWPYFDADLCFWDPDTCESEHFLANYEGPLLYGADRIKPPAGLDYYNHPSIPEFENSLIVGLLADGNEITVARLNEDMDSIISDKMYPTDFFRQRDICSAPNGTIYVIGFDRGWDQENGQYCKIFKMYNPDFVSNTSEEVSKSKKLKIYPNPTSHILNIDLDSSIKDFQLKLIDHSGRILKFIESKRNSLDLGDYSSHVFYVTGWIDGVTISEKIIVQNPK